MQCLQADELSPPTEAHAPVLNPVGISQDLTLAADIFLALTWKAGQEHSAFWLCVTQKLLISSPVFYVCSKTAKPQLGREIAKTKVRSHKFLESQLRIHELNHGWE